MFYELSVGVAPNLPRYNDTIPRPEFRPFTSIKAGDINNQTIFSLFTHIGSHVDAPYHFCEQGESIDQIDLGSFLFTRALLVNVEAGKGGRVGVECLKACEGLEGADILLFNMGYSRFCADEPVYRDDFPALTLEAAKFLRENLTGLKAIALDTLSVDGTDGFETGFANHHALLDVRADGLRPLLIYENMNFTPILGRRDYFRAYGIPLRLKGLDASPVTMIAEF